MDRFTFDDDYVRRLREHDARTEQHFYDYFYPRLFNHLRRRVPSAEDVQDIRQETFRRVLEKIYAGELRQGGALFGFVFKFSDYILLEHYRKSSRVEPIGDHPEAVIEDDPLVDLIIRETQLLVRAVLADLEPRDAEILRAIFIHEVAREEVCRKFGVTSGYLRVLLHRALTHFAEKFPPDDETNPH